MEKILKFLKEAKLCFVATADGDQPYVRPQSFTMEYDGKLCCCTADGKETSKQLKKNPKVEIAACQGTKFIRVRGKAEFLADDAAKKALEMMPSLEKMIHPGKFEIFAVTGGTAVITDLATGETETIEL